VVICCWLNRCERWGEQLCGACFGGNIQIRKSTAANAKIIWETKLRNGMMHHTILVLIARSMYVPPNEHQHGVMLLSLTPLAHSGWLGPSAGSTTASADRFKTKKFVYQAGGSLHSSGPGIFTLATYLLCTTLISAPLTPVNTTKFFNPCIFSKNQPGIVSNSEILITVGLRNLSRLHHSTTSYGIEFWQQSPAREPVN